MWFLECEICESWEHSASFHRSYYEQNSLQTEVQLLQPVNLEVAVERNLAAAWYHEVPDIEISGRLKPMNVSTCFWKQLLKYFWKTDSFSSIKVQAQ